MDEVVVPVVCNDIWPGPAGWVPFSAAPRIWQSLVRCSFWFDSGYMLRQSTVACGRYSSWTRCACTSLCNDRCRIVRTFLLLRRGSSPWSSSSCSRCSSRTRLLLCPSLFNDRCRSSAVAVLTVVDTPVFAQWLISMVLTIEISSYSLTRWSSSLLCRMCCALRCRLVVKVSLLMVLTILYGTA